MKSFAPHAGRGLKRLHTNLDSRVCSFRPARGAWIETASRQPDAHQVPAFAPHAGRGLKHAVLPSPVGVYSAFAPHAGRGLKPRGAFTCPARYRFRPARGAWIET